MRRKDREIQSTEEKLAVITKCKVCRLAMELEGQPYILPLNYGYSYQNDQLTLYFHSAKEGFKMDILGQNNKVCFEMDCEHRLMEGKNACEYSYAFESVIGFGLVEFLENLEDKAAALTYFMRHQTGTDDTFQFNENHLNAVAVYKVTATSFTGKKRV